MSVADVLDMGQDLVIMDRKVLDEVAPPRGVLVEVLGLNPLEELDHGTEILPVPVGGMVRAAVLKLDPKDGHLEEDGSHSMKLLRQLLLCLRELHKPPFVVRRL